MVVILDGDKKLWLGGYTMKIKDEVIALLSPFKCSE
jgi:hypothetical protein